MYNEMTFDEISIYLLFFINNWLFHFILQFSIYKFKIILVKILNGKNSKAKSLQF